MKALQSAKMKRGSALLVALMVMVVLSLTGLTFLYVSDTENAISNNYARALETLYTAQSGIYLVNQWYQSNAGTFSPGGAGLRPRLADMTLNARPGATDGSGSGTDTTYKNGVQANFFERPFSGAVDTPAVYNQFFGTEDTPDMVIDIDGNGADYLAEMNDKLFGTDSQPDSKKVRISKLEIYAPPMSPYADNPTFYDATKDPARNTAFGVCTVKVTAEMLQGSNVVATRVVQGVISDINYSTSNVALDTGGSLEVNGAAMVHWGHARAESNYAHNNWNHFGIGAVWWIDPTTNMVEPCSACYGDATGQPMEGITMYDPWFMFRSRGSFEIGTGAGNFTLPTGLGACTGNAVAYTPRAYTGVSPWNDPTVGFDSTLINPALCTPHTSKGAIDVAYNVFACDPNVAFGGGFRGYTYWKNIVTKLAKDNPKVKYLRPVAVDADLWETGDGTQNTFEGWTNGQEGIFFFESLDGQVPRNDLSNVVTAEINIKGGWWSKGVIYLNATDFRMTGGMGSGSTTTFQAPAEPLYEPWPDSKNKVYDHPDERWLNLQYSTSIPSNPCCTGLYTVSAAAAGQTNNAGDTTTGWDRWGYVNPNTKFSFEGIFYTTADLRFTGGYNFYGSLMARAIGDGSGSASGGLEIYYKDSLSFGDLGITGLPNTLVDQIIFDY